MLNEFVVVRTYSAGVHCGTLKTFEGKHVVLTDARRLWRWRGANTLSEVSQSGVAEEWTRLSEPVPEIALTDAVEVIKCSVVGVIKMDDQENYGSGDGSGMGPGTVMGMGPGTVTVTVTGPGTGMGMGYSDGSGSGYGDG